jgi:hypothetical protein
MFIEYMRNGVVLLLKELGEEMVPPEAGRCHSPGGKKQKP